MRIFLLTLLVALATAKDEYRLPQAILPENYKLDILTHLGPEESNFNFIGDVKIEVSKAKFCNLGSLTWPKVRHQVGRSVLVLITIQLC